MREDIVYNAGKCGGKKKADDIQAVCHGSCIYSAYSELWIAEGSDFQK